MPSYEQSVPGLMCRSWFDQCIVASGEDAAQQYSCTQARDTECGNLTIQDATNAGNGVAASGSGSASSGSPSATSSGSSPSGTESAAASASSAAPASGAAHLVMYGSSALVGGLLAVFGLAL